eukprot:gene18563-22209_t
MSAIRLKDKTQKKSNLEKMTFGTLKTLSAKLSLPFTLRKDTLVDAILDAEADNIPKTSSLSNYHRGLVNYALPSNLISRIFRRACARPTYGMDSVRFFSWKLSLGLVSKEFFNVLARQFDTLSLVHSRPYRPYLANCTKVSAASTLCHHVANPVCQFNRIRVLDITVQDLFDIQACSSISRQRITRTIEKLSLHSLSSDPDTNNFNNRRIRNYRGYNLTEYTALTSLSLNNISGLPYNLPPMPNIRSISILQTDKMHRMKRFDFSVVFPNATRIMTALYPIFPENYYSSQITKLGLLYTLLRNSLSLYSPSINRFSFIVRPNNENPDGWRLGIETLKDNAISHLVVVGFTNVHHTLLNKYPTITSLEILYLIDRGLSSKAYRELVSSIFEILDQCTHVTHAILYVQDISAISIFESQDFANDTNYQLTHTKYKSRDFTLQSPSHKLYFQRPILV